MAFTVAHMAAALPFFKRDCPNYSYRWLNFEAMMIGSIMPDLPYFIGNILPNIGGRPAWEISHSWIGLLSYCIPWGLFLYFLWVLWFKPAFFGLIKPFLSFSVHAHETQSPAKRKRWSREQPIASKLTHWLSWSLIPLLIGVGFGAITHILWDATTHVDGFISTRIDFLQQFITVYPIGEMKVARFLQFFTSIIGLLALLWFAVSLFLQGRRAKHPPYSFNNQLLSSIEPAYPFTKKQSLTTVTGLAILITLIGIWEGIRFYSLLPSDIYGFMVKFLIHSLRKIAFLLVLYTLFYHLFIMSHRNKIKQA